MTLVICRTCPRYDRRARGDFAGAFAAALREVRAPSVDVGSVRQVLCLGGCPDAGVVALEGPGKARVRFTGLTPADAFAVLVAATAYDCSTTGHPDDWAVPEQLVHRLSSVTNKRLPPCPSVASCHPGEQQRS